MLRTTVQLLTHFIGYLKYIVYNHLPRKERLEKNNLRNDNS